MKYHLVGTTVADYPFQVSMKHSFQWLKTSKDSLIYRWKAGDG